jgi:DNA topoisomerase-3
VEAKETKPPPRYSEGTLIEAMANAWRFVENPEHRERLKEAKGIGTPATRAEIIQGLKRQDLLMASGTHIVPTERGIALFGILDKADGALVDPGVTAKLEFLLDEVLIGRRRAGEAIDAVCGQATRIIGRLLDGAASGGAVLPAVASRHGRTVRGDSKRVRRTRNSGSPLPNARTESAIPHARDLGPAPSEATPALRSRANRNARSVGSVITGGERSGKGGGRTAKRGSNGQGSDPGRTSHATGTAGGTPLTIPFGNKEVALGLGARYRAGGWFAPLGTNLEPFREKGWL